MAIGISNTSSGDGGSLKNDEITFSHTVGGNGNRLLVVGVGKRDGVSANAVSGLTFGGVSLTKLSEIHNGTRETGAEIWYLINPSSGAGNIVATMDVECFFAAGALDLYNVHQTVPFGTPVTLANTLNMAMSSDVSSAVGELVLDIAAKKFTATSDGTLTQGANQTLRCADNTTHADDSNNVNIGISTEPGASTTTMSWSWTSGNRYAAQIAVAIKNQDYTSRAPRVMVFFDRLLNWNWQKKGGIWQTSPSLI